MTQFHTEGDKVYFIYANTQDANDALERLKHLKPHICSRGGYFNALVVDMDRVPTMGEA